MLNFLIILHPISLVSLLWVSHTFGFYVHMWAFLTMKKSRWYLWAHLLNCRKEAMKFQPCSGNKTELLIPDCNNMKVIVLWTWKASDVLFINTSLEQHRTHQWKPNLPFWAENQTSHSAGSLCLLIWGTLRSSSSPQNGQSSRCLCWYESCHNK